VSTTARPSGNWLRMHRGHGPEFKVRHRTWLGAWWHQRSNQGHFKVDADKVWIYPCWFTAENTTGRKHYHIGHIKRSKRYDASAAKPRNGTLMWGVFAVEDGFEVRTFDVKPARCHPPRTTITEAVLEYLREPGEE
jgi:hypothetical protein